MVMPGNAMLSLRACVDTHQDTPVVAWAVHAEDAVVGKVE